MQVLISLVAFTVAIAVLITVHEFGHFIVARALGVKVLRFSVGFGRPLFRWRPRGETEYVISALPFGGYVKLLDEREGEVGEQERGRAFNNQPIFSRAAILVAGPGFNLLFAVLAYWIVFMVGVPGIKPILGPVASGTPAARAGLAEGDALLAVAGEQTATWAAARLALLERVISDRPIPVKVRTRRGEERRVLVEYSNPKALTRPGALLRGLGFSIWMPPIPPVLGRLAPDGPAARADLRPGERVVSIEGHPIRNWKDLRRYVQKRPDTRLRFRLQTSAGTREITVFTASRKINGQVIGHIGAAPAIPRDYARNLRADMKLDPLAAGQAAFSRTGQITVLTALMFYRMVAGQASLANLSGPISIAQYAGALFAAGVVPFLFFLAIISISLGILNLLPIPLLDGGQLFYLAIEAVRRKPLSERIEMLGQQIGIGLLVLLLGFAVFNDLSRIIHS